MGLSSQGCDRAYWLAWSQIQTVGPVTQKHLWETFGSLKAAWHATASELLTVDGIGLLTSEKIVAQRRTIDPEALLTKHEANNDAFWTPADADYPALLFAIVDPPPVLYYRGPYRPNDDIDRLSVGIVGTRQPSAYGVRWTEKLSGALTDAGTVIVSGLAKGIDTIAHEQCLTQKGQTIAVLGTGVDQIYPARNRTLYRQIAETGLVVSEYPDGTGPDRTHFPQRNRIIAGLSRATLVSEAPARSGALITARLANDYGREVYALPSSLDNVQGAGCLNLIAQGSQVVLGIAQLNQALAELPAIARDWPGVAAWTHQQSDRQVQQSTANPETVQTSHAAVDSLEKNAGNLPTISPAKLPASLQTVFNAIGSQPLLLDQIVVRSQLDTGAVLAALVQLELDGWVEQLPGMQYQRAVVA